VLSNIHGISHAARAAGAIWVQFEMTLGASQQGWIQAIQMRTLKLMGREEVPGAPRAFTINVVLAAVFVALMNIPLLMAPRGFSNLVSNDPDVAGHFRSIVWVLALHSQFRVMYFSLGEILIPLGRRNFKICANVVAFWVIAAPLTCVAALTDTFTRDKTRKMAFCFLCCVLANALLTIVFGVYLLRLDWRRAARVVAGRANTDRPVEPEQLTASEAGAHKAGSPE
jgi:Na+-driven multidrug efflux pump